MTRVLHFTNDQRGNNRLRFIHQGLSQSPLAANLDEPQTRRYLSLLDRLETASVPDPEHKVVSHLDYVPRVLSGAVDVDVSDDEILQIGEFVMSVPWVGWLRKHVIEAVDWARSAPKAE